MKLYKLALLLCICLIKSHATAQVAFPNKVMIDTTYQGQPNLSALKGFKKLTGKSATTKTATAPVNFQMPVNIDSAKQEKRYLHTKVVRSSNKLPVFINSRPSQVAMTKSTKDPLKVSMAYLQETQDILQIKDAKNEFKVKSSFTDRLGKTHVKLQQTYQGIKIFGAEVIVHLNDRKEVEIFNGRNIKTPEIASITPKLSSEEALTRAKTDLGISESILTEAAGLHQFHEHLQPEKELLIYQTKQHENKLVWHVTVFANSIERWEYFIDAQNGDIVNKYNHTCSFAPEDVTVATDLKGVSRTINTAFSNGAYYMINTSKPMYDANSILPDQVNGAIITLDLQNSYPTEDASYYYVADDDNNWNYPTAVSAAYNADVAFDYYYSTFGRNSIDGNGGNIYSIINVTNEDGSGLDNAFWNGFAMYYGNGNEAFSPLAASLDVGGHEMSHGVIGSTANLVYQDQSGALNESFADVFAVCIDRDDWGLAEGICNPVYFPTGLMRDMSDPHNGGTQLGENGYQPAHMSEYYTGNQDNGGVHVNSGIPNHAFYLIASNIGRDKAEQVYYRTLTTYLTTNSQFQDLRLGVIQSIIDLYGADAPELNIAGSAFDAVGIYADANKPEEPEEIPIATGDEYLLLYGTHPEDEYTLYIFDPVNEEYYGASYTPLYRKPSISDDGSVALMVTANYTLNYLELDGTTVNENTLDNSPNWRNVSLSKDATKIAAIGTTLTNSIVVGELNDDRAVTFELYNPTSNEGVTTGNVLYADALEWDYTGQYIMYDALNIMQNANGEDISYWDVNFIKVWDNATNTFGDGTVQKLFSTLPEGISIGNPSFSKTSRNVVAFDLYDANNNTYNVLNANIETGELVYAVNNTTFGFPSYNKSDESVVFDYTDPDTQVEYIAYVPIGSDKITPSGDPSLYIQYAKWGNWYSTSSRQILSTENDILHFSFKGINPVSEGTISGNQIDVTVPAGTPVNNLIASFSLSANATVAVNGINQMSGVSKNDFSNAVVYTVTAEDGTTKNYTVTVGGGALGTQNRVTETDNLKIYPNPFSEEITLVSNALSPNSRILITNMLGQTVFTANTSNMVSKTSDSAIIQLSALTPGAYTIHIINHENTISSRIIKR